jgi:hypothetical protein
MATPHKLESNFVKARNMAMHSNHSLAEKLRQEFISRLDIQQGLAGTDFLKRKSFVSNLKYRKAW